MNSTVKGLKHFPLAALKYAILVGAD